MPFNPPCKNCILQHTSQPLLFTPTCSPVVSRASYTKFGWPLKHLWTYITPILWKKCVKRVLRTNTRHPCYLDILSPQKSIFRWQNVLWCSAPEAIINCWLLLEAMQVSTCRNTSFTHFENTFIRTFVCASFAYKTTYPKVGWLWYDKLINTALKIQTGKTQQLAVQRWLLCLNEKQSARASWNMQRCCVQISAAPGSLQHLKQRTPRGCITEHNPRSEASLILHAKQK